MRNFILRSQTCENMIGRIGCMFMAHKHVTVAADARPVGARSQTRFAESDQSRGLTERITELAAHVRDSA